MDDESNFNLTKFTENCLEDFCVCTVIVPLTIVCTVAATLSPYFSLFSEYAKSASVMFGLCHPIGMLQGFLLMRYSQGSNDKTVTDNDAAMFFLGVFVLVACAAMFVIDFTRSLGLKQGKAVIAKLITSAIVCLGTIVIIILPSKDLYYLIGFGNIFCIGMLTGFHSLLTFIGACRNDKQILPIIYPILYSICFACWTGTIISYNSENLQNIELLGIFSVAFFAEAANTVINLCIAPKKREQPDSTSFGQNIWMLGNSKNAEG